jgi:hypothetical protein
MGNKRHYNWLLWITYSLILSSLAAGCTLITPPGGQTTPTASVDQPPTRPAETTAAPTLISPTNTLQPSAETPVPTQTLPQPSATSSVPTETPEPAFDYFIQPGSPSYIPNIFNQEFGCGWMGVGGQIFDRTGAPVTGVLVEIEGMLNDQPILGLSISGGAPQYGAGGYEIKLSDLPIASEGRLQIVLYDLQGRALSDQLVFDTMDSCTANLILINFLSSEYYQTRYFLPIAGNHSNP